MIYFVPFSFFVIVAIDAYSDTNRSVNHRRGAWLYIFACTLLSALFFFKSDISWYHFIVLSILTRLAFFDIEYNFLMGNSFSYEGDLNKPDTSWFDKLESKIPLSTFWKRILYLVIYKGYLIFYFYAN